MNEQPFFKPYRRPAGGWGSARSLGNILRREAVLGSGSVVLTRQNKVDGFQCVSCAWIKPAQPLPFEFCENGAKATAWEITTRRCTPDFFARHTVTELLSWDDYHLEQEGRLTHPLRYDAASDKYVPVSWGTAIKDIGERLRKIETRKNVVFYSSGRTSNEASYLYALFARAYGNNNLPDSSNMCHETTSVALPESLGVPVGTVTLDDFAKADCIMFFGQNPGSNSPRMLHALQEASERGVPIIVYNPLRERGLETFTNPQSVTEMVLRQETRIASQYNQVKAGGDLAALTGVCKALFDLDEEARKADRPAVIDDRFVAEHTHGFDAFKTFVRKYDWETLERRSGLSREAMEATAKVYARSTKVIGIYGMGLTQHQAGVQTVQMLVNLLLARGNIGKDGAGICPVRGHSNVQGQRTVGITEKPKLVPMDRLARQYDFNPPTEEGLNTVEACEAIIAGKIDAFVMLGGNFVRAIPDRDVMEAAWRKIPLTVNISTKLNRSHLVHGEVSYILPVLGRIERDMQEDGPQDVSMEDTSGCIHGSRGIRTPASPHLLSEIRLVCELAKATLEPNPKMTWDAWYKDYGRIRTSIGETYPEIFYDYSRRMWEPGGFHRPMPARERVWKTKTGRANFIAPTGLDEDKDMPEIGHDAFRMMTLRSNDQFNTTVYGYTDRFRGVHGTRDIVFMNRADIDRLGLRPGQRVTLRTQSKDNVERKLADLSIIAYNIPVGCVGTYYPEANVLLPLWHYAEGSKTPAAKSIPVTIHAQ